MTSEAIDESLGKEVREAQGLKGGVVRLIYMTAFILPLGQSLGSMYGEKYGPMMSATVRMKFNFSLLINIHQKVSYLGGS